MLGSLCGKLNALSIRASPLQPRALSALFSTLPADVEVPQSTATALDDLGDDHRFAVGAFVHHKKRFTNYKKFESPRKRANKLYDSIMKEHIEKAKENTPEVWQEHFRVGDAVEIDVVLQGGANTTDRQNMTKYRGVVLGIFRRKLDHSILLKDVIDGHPLEMIVPLHSPLVKSLKVLERNFPFKGRKKIKRAKLYYLSDWNPNFTAVTGSTFKKKKAALRLAAKAKK
eukprot:CAMPEP_0168777444 /NCGR_PEP_ID=MMETSP0725-20121227/6561_1 /TAXON_ID=265536 /ORGANISM="Amphiprora sp., Strain CCMP467" /LENGTH=227 /DNA_ID=CAMNT_0008827165 /DNA_START=32 /DNA_END=715 /DNA_ORIENTATION=-